MINDTCLTKLVYKEQQQDGQRVNLYIDLWFYICLSYDGVHFNWYTEQRFKTVPNCFRKQMHVKN